MQANSSGVQAVAALLGTVLTGAGTFGVANWLFAYLASCGVSVTPVQKRVLVLPVSLAIAGAAYGIGIALGIYTFTPDGLLLAFTAAFTASQMWHLPALAAGKAT
jgi:hypothetical protein